MNTGVYRKRHGKTGVGLLYEFASLCRHHTTGIEMVVYIPLRCRTGLGGDGAALRPEHSTGSHVECTGERHRTVEPDWTPTVPLGMFGDNPSLSMGTTLPQAEEPAAPTFEQTAFQDGASGGGGGGADFSAPATAEAPSGESSSASDAGSRDDSGNSSDSGTGSDVGSGGGSDL